MNYPDLHVQITERKFLRAESEIAVTIEPECQRVPVGH